MSLPIYNCQIDENLMDETGIYAISFVESPANETDFIKLGKEHIFLNKDTQKQILTGVVLKPNQYIYRNSEQLGEHYITFSAEQIEKIARKMMKTGLALHNTTHQHQMPLSGNYLIELWLVENPENDKANALGFKDLPKGTLMCSYKVENTHYWQTQVMTGNVKGFSLEGFFAQVKTKTELSNKNKTDMSKKKFKFNPFVRGVLLTAIGKQKLSEIEDIIQDDTTDSGEEQVRFMLANGSEVIVDADGYATVDEMPLSAGEHVLSDGNILVIDSENKFVETKTPSEEQNEPAQATAPETLKRQNMRNQKLQETPVDTDIIAVLENRIADLESQLADALSKIQEAQDIAEEAKEEVQELKKHTPSANPVTPARQPNPKPRTEMKAHERMAEAINLQLQRKK